MDALRGFGTLRDSHDSPFFGRCFVVRGVSC
jgi:hypothetical protein